jgi:hypothetical protein
MKDPGPSRVVMECRGRLRNRRLLLVRLENGDFVIEAKMHLKGREIRVTRTRYSEEAMLFIIHAATKLGAASQHLVRPNNSLEQRAKDAGQKP